MGNIAQKIVDGIEVISQKEMKKRGHRILITATKKDLTFQLLKNYGFDFINLGGYGKYRLAKLFHIAIIDWRMWRATKDFCPDIFLGLGSFSVAHVAKILQKKCFIFEDSESTPFEHFLYVYFTDKILTPTCFRKNFGQKQIRYKGYHELAYLHSNYFKPDKKILKLIGHQENEKFFILRFVAWQAGHDFGRAGLSTKDKSDLIHFLKKHGKVLISSEEPLPEAFKEYGIKISPEKIHSALYYADLFIGDSQTMATEAAILGTPAIRCNSFVGPHDMSNFIELEKKYDLMYSFRDYRQTLHKIKTLFRQKNLKLKWRQKAKQLLQDKIDVTRMMIDLVDEIIEE